MGAAWVMLGGINETEDGDAWDDNAGAVVDANFLLALVVIVIDVVLLGLIADDPTANANAADEFLDKLQPAPIGGVKYCRRR